MVDALRRARRWLRPKGCVIDIHPTAQAASVELGDRETGTVEAGDAPRRHAAADAAVAVVFASGLFDSAHSEQFAFYTYGDSVEELRDYIEDNWRDARIDSDTVRRTRAALLEAPGLRPRVRERVRLTKLTLAPRRA